MNTIEQAREVAKTLRLQAMEIAALGNAGWGNTMIDASNTIDALLVELERIKGQEPVGRIASNGYPELYKPHSLPAWTLLYLAAGAQPAPKQEPTQPGYQLVPVEPTEGMVIKFAQIFNVSNQSGTFRPAYKAMLAAAKE